MGSCGSCCTGRDMSIDRKKQEGRYDLPLQQSSSSRVHDGLIASNSEVNQLADGSRFLFRAILDQRNDGTLEWCAEEAPGYEGTLVSASQPRDKNRIIDGVYFFSELSVKLNLHKGIFQSESD